MIQLDKLFNNITTATETPTNINRGRHNNHSITSSSLIKNFDFFETQVIESETKTEIVDVDDDLKIEVELYKNALESARKAVQKFESDGRPFFRPSDYFAEMIKSDAHMETVRLRLIEEAEGLKASEEAKKKRELKRFGKAIQVENKLQREKESKRLKEGVKELRKKRKDGTKLDGQDEQEFEIALEETLSNSKKRGREEGAGVDQGRKKTRTARNNKFGRPKPKGVTGRRWKENTKESANSFEGMGGKGDGRLSSGSGRGRGIGRGRGRGGVGSGRGRGAGRGAHRAKRT